MTSFERWSRIPVPARRVLVAGRRLSHAGRRPRPRIDIAMADGVAVLTLDDGKVNAISERVTSLFSDALDRVEADDRVQALVIGGRPGQFSAGFDLDTLMVGGAARDRLIRGGWNLLMRIFTLPLPVVIACTGNAVAAGAAILLAGDTRLGVEGAFKIGFNEAAIGLPLPEVVLTLAGDRLRADAFDEAMRGARLYRPDDAVAAGFLHRVVPPAQLHDAAIAEARALAAWPTFRQEKEAKTTPVADRMRGRLPDDLALIARIGA